MLKTLAALMFLGLTADMAYAVPILCSPCLFYGGDFNGSDPTSDATANGKNMALWTDARMYDNAIVGSAGWNVTGIFTNDLINPGTIFVGGHWEIRSGVSEGVGGTVVASGDVSGPNFSYALNGQDGFGLLGGFARCNTPSVLLNPNTTYWFECTPVGNGTGNSDQATTADAGALGNHIENMAFFDSPGPPFLTSFANANDPGVCFPGSSCSEYSFGVIGTETQTPVPEPSSVLLLGTGMLTVTRWLRRRSVGQ